MKKEYEQILLCCKKLENAYSEYLKLSDSTNEEILKIVEPFLNEYSKTHGEKFHSKNHQMKNMYADEYGIIYDGGRPECWKCDDYSGWFIKYEYLFGEKL